MNGRAFSFLLPFLWLPGCQKGTVAEATLELVNQQISVSVRRIGSHQFLAEYERSIVLRAAHKNDLVHPMLPDSGGTIRINLYRPNGNTLLLLDRLGLYRVDLAKFSVEILEPTPPPAGSAFVGSFDQESGKWQFIAAGKRKELSIENQSAG
jgi:hypothetical protein